MPSATINGYLDIKVFESWNCLEYWIILCPCESCRDLALLTVSICSDHYQLSCPSRFLSFLPPVWNEPSGAVCRVLFNYIKQPLLILSSHRVPSLAQLHFKWDFSVTTPKTAHWFISFFPPCLISPSHASFSSSPSVFDLVTSRCVMACSTYLYLLLLNKLTHRAGETSLKELMCSTLMCHDTFAPQGKKTLSPERPKILKTEDEHYVSVFWNKTGLSVKPNLCGWSAANEVVSILSR